MIFFAEEYINTVWQCHTHQIQLSCKDSPEGTLHIKHVLFVNHFVVSRHGSLFNLFYKVGKFFKIRKLVLSLLFTVKRKQ